MASIFIICEQQERSPQRHRVTEKFQKNRGFGFSVPLWWILSLVMHRTISHPNLLFGTCRCLRNRVRNRARPARRRMPEEIARGYVPAPAAPYFEFPPPLSIRKSALGLQSWSRARMADSFPSPAAFPRALISATIRQ